MSYQPNENITNGVWAAVARIKECVGACVLPCTKELEISRDRRDGLITDLAVQLVSIKSFQNK